MQRVIKTDVFIADTPEGECFPATLSLLLRDGKPPLATRLHIEFPEGLPPTFSEATEGVPCDFYLSAHKLQRFLAREGRCDDNSCTFCASEGE